jgi:hypothetical protein
MVEVPPDCLLPATVPGRTDFDLVLSLSAIEVVMMAVSGQGCPRGHSDRLVHLLEGH